MEVRGNASGSGALLGGTASRSYDLRSWQGLTEILKQARESRLSDGEYASFRDTVLEYAQSGGDESLRAKIESVVSTLPPPAQKTAVQIQTVNEPVLEQKEETPKSRIGKARPMPKFSSPAKTVTQKDTASAVPLRAKTEERGVPKNLPTNGAIPRVVERPLAAEPVEQAPQEPAVLETPKSEAPPQAQKIAPQAPKLSKEDAEHYRIRIAEIKHAVNARVGNPATLIDDGNQIGREYMNALLAAMKATAGGEKGSLEIAMARLEKAHEIILEYAKRREVETPKPSPVRIVEIKKEETKNEEPRERLASETGRNAAPDMNVKIAEFEKNKKASLANIRQMIAETKLTDDEDNMVPKEKVYTDQPRPVKDTVPEHVQKTSPPIPSLVEQKETLQTVAAAPAASGSELGLPVKQLATSAVPKKLYNPQARNENDPSIPDLVGNESQRVRELQEDVYSAEVTEALAHLLDDWSLFSKSGFLGLGPGGVNHPLYKKISPVSMFFVTSGRFEGATPEIRQSILDYVNAWRHEQGVTYNPSETFEHYLRRVIARILKRQKQAIGA